mgnify:CR=1 FL=1
MKKPTPTKLKQKIEKYLKDCIENNKLPTKNGVCITLDIHRDTYNEWKKSNDLSDALKKIEVLIEEHWTQGLYSKSYDTAGCIFYLKNAFQWRDRTETDITSGGKPIPPFDYTKRK